VEDREGGHRGEGVTAIAPFCGRVPAHVLTGRALDRQGQFSCGNKRCGSTEGLASYEVNFSYIEDGAKKNELVKVRVHVTRGTEGG
jgi:hypothetical protein